VSPVTAAAAQPESDTTGFAGALRVSWLGGPRPTYFLTRFALLRGLGFIYSVAFLVLWQQWPGLIGSRGLLPAQRFLTRIAQDTSFFELPTLFALDASDAALGLFAALGLALSLAVMLGLDSAPAMFALWALYLSFCHIGQLFWGYGWEILLLEAGFLGIFLCPLRGRLALRGTLPPPATVVFLFRWLLFRLMFGAGLIKLRGDACWRELTCLAFHYETQPVPSPMSWLLHQAPMGFHMGGVAFNHFVELVVPFGVLCPRPLRHWAGALTVLFQSMLIVSGNLSFLNWLTIVVAFACFDDGAWSRVLPARWSSRVPLLEAARVPSRAQGASVTLLALLVAVLSVGPVVNMLSPHQAMNTSFDPLHLVNSYGAFGSVGKVRHEVVIQGTMAARPGADAVWRDYELPCKPGDVARRPCLITPYHYRLDWQLWFAAMSEPAREPWLMHLAYALLRAEPEVLKLFALDPFGGKPPHYVRMELYEYRFTHWGDGDRHWWTRKRIDRYLPPVSVDNPALLRYLGAYDLLPPDDGRRPTKR